MLGEEDVRMGVGSNLGSCARRTFVLVLLNIVALCVSVAESCGCLC